MSPNSTPISCFDPGRDKYACRNPYACPFPDHGGRHALQVAEERGGQGSSGDVIGREIETDKATMEVEAVDEGTIGKLLIEAGTEGVR